MFSDEFLSRFHEAALEGNVAELDCLLGNERHEIEVGAHTIEELSYLLGATLLRISASTVSHHIVASWIVDRANEYGITHLPFAEYAALTLHTEVMMVLLRFIESASTIFSMGTYSSDVTDPSITINEDNVDIYEQFEQIVDMDCEIINQNQSTENHKSPPFFSGLFSTKHFLEDGDQS